MWSWTFLPDIDIRTDGKMLQCKTYFWGKAGGLFSVHEIKVQARKLTQLSISKKNTGLVSAIIMLESHLLSEPQILKCLALKSMYL
jgi:hypothetical protein